MPVVYTIMKTFIPYREYFKINISQIRQLNFCSCLVPRESVNLLVNLFSLFLSVLLLIFRFITYSFFYSVFFLNFSNLVSVLSISLIIFLLSVKVISLCRPPLQTTNVQLLDLHENAINWTILPKAAFTSTRGNVWWCLVYINFAWKHSHLEIYTRTLFTPQDKITHFLVSWRLSTRSHPICRKKKMSVSPHFSVSYHFTFLDAGEHNIGINKRARIQVTKMKRQMSTSKNRRTVISIFLRTSRIMLVVSKKVANVSFVFSTIALNRKGSINSSYYLLAAGYSFMIYV